MAYWENTLFQASIASSSGCCAGCIGVRHTRKCCALLDALEEIGFTYASAIDEAEGAIEGLASPQLLVLLRRKIAETLVGRDL